VNHWAEGKAGETGLTETIGLKKVCPVAGRRGKESIKVANESLHTERTSAQKLQRHCKGCVCATWTYNGESEKASKGRTRFVPQKRRLSRVVGEER